MQILAWTYTAFMQGEVVIFEGQRILIHHPTLLKDLKWWLIYFLGFKIFSFGEL